MKKKRSRGVKQGDGRTGGSEGEEGAPVQWLAVVEPRVVLRRASRLRQRGAQDVDVEVHVAAHAVPVVVHVPLLRVHTHNDLHREALQGPQGVRRVAVGGRAVHQQHQDGDLAGGHRQPTDLVRDLPNVAANGGLGGERLDVQQGHDRGQAGAAVLPEPHRAGRRLLVRLRLCPAFPRRQQPYFCGGV